MTLRPFPGQPLGLPLIAVGNTGSASITRYSYDGVTWQDGALPFFGEIGFDGVSFVGLDYNNVPSLPFYSANGLAWNGGGTSPANSGSPKSRFSRNPGGRWAAGTNTRVALSDDGVNWFSSTTTFSYNTPIWTGTKWVAPRGGNSSSFWTGQSVDNGVTFQNTPQPTFSPANPTRFDTCVMFQGGIYMFGTANAAAFVIYRSLDDNLTYQRQFTSGTISGTGVAASPTAIIYGNRATIAPIADNYLRSTDGVTWTPMTLPLDTFGGVQITSVIYVDSAFYMLTRFGSIYRSIDDGLTFTQVNAGVSTLNNWGFMV